LERGGGVGGVCFFTLILGLVGMVDDGYGISAWVILHVSRPNGELLVLDLLMVKYCGVGWKTWCIEADVDCSM
jgi:hypothetical protein